MENRLIRGALAVVVLSLYAWSGIVLFTTDGFMRNSRNDSSPVMRQLVAVRGEVRQAERLHLEAARALYLAGELTAAPLSVSLHDDVTDADSALIMERLAAELAAVPQRHARLGVATLPGDFGQYSPSPLYSSLYQIYAGTDPMGPYCVALSASADRPTLLTVDTTSDVRARRSQQPTLLGPCRWWLQYGAPGAALATWLDSGAYHFFDAPAEWLDESGRPDVRRAVFGHHKGQSHPQQDACMAGRADACTALMDLVASDTPGPAAYTRSRNSGVFGWADGAMFAHVEREFGADRFARFWTSPQPPQQAFEAAFGVPMGDWMIGWAQRHYGVEPRGPGIGWAGLLLSLMTLAGLAAVTLWIVQRRSAG